MVVLGTIAFYVTEGVSVAYAFVWTLDTVTTLGALRDPGTSPGAWSSSYSSCSA